ncbi:unnamed protein product [Dibothriocephalus latus]|uniref:Uncharacterized protein n=1 Tax=Dibothriocephalus latus TaxID=60516 RepID=A0A3P7MTF7_DIBLA|nr:unnamed protein product [Dibothriocephalus latus]
MPYNNFYLTTVTNAKDYNAARTAVNPLLATNSSVASSPYQLPVNVSGMNIFQLSASMPQAAAEFMRNKEGPADLTPDGDPSIELNPNAVSPRRFVDYATSEQLPLFCFIFFFLFIIIVSSLHPLTRPAPIPPHILIFLFLISTNYFALL